VLFRSVRVVEEAHFPIEYVVDDPTTQAIIKKSKISARNAKEFAEKFAEAVASIKVYGVKPK